MKKRLFLVLTLIFIGFSVFPADIISEFKNLRGSSTVAFKAIVIDIPKKTYFDIPNKTEFDVPNKTEFILLNPDYPVIPGDTYQVEYMSNHRSENIDTGSFSNFSRETLHFFIEADKSADLSIFGNINTRGLSFGELKVKVENIVRKAYPGSLPRLTIVSTGTFPILIKGEVKNPGFANAWGFSRLSDLIADKLTKYSSLRDIEIINIEGNSKTFDLFNAAIESDLTKNPRIKPGETIILHRYNREIYVKGEVRHPGSFQLLDGESLPDVIEKYCGGFTKLADTANLQIIHLNTQKGETDTVYPKKDSGVLSKIVLRDMDMIKIPSLIEKLPMVFFEGALGMKVGSTSPVSAKIPWAITKDQRISTAVQNLPAGSITPVSDLKNSFIIRQGNSDYIPVDLEKIIYNHNYSDDVVLKKGDRIIIPMKRFTVYVGGSVAHPSSVPYIAGKTYLEYVQMAGGFNIDEHVGSSVSIFDKNGNKYGKNRIIQPEDRIFAPRNSLNYYFNNKMGTYVGTTAALIALVVSFFSLQAQFQ